MRVRVRVCPKSDLEQTACKPELFEWVRLHGTSIATCLHAESEHSDLTWRMPRSIWVFIGENSFAGLVILWLIIKTHSRHARFVIVIPLKCPISQVVVFKARVWSGQGCSLYIQAGPDPFVRRYMGTQWEAGPGTYEVGCGPSVRHLCP